MKQELDKLRALINKASKGTRLLGDYIDANGSIGDEVEPELIEAEGILVNSRVDMLILLDEIEDNYGTDN